MVNDFRKTNIVNMSRKKANGERDTLLTKMDIKRCRLLKRSIKF